MPLLEIRLGMDWVGYVEFAVERGIRMCPRISPNISIDEDDIPFSSFIHQPFPRHGFLQLFD